MEEPLIRTLEEQIAEKIKNYRKGTGVYDAEHVDRWISQFPEEERMVVLTETKRLLEQNYVDQAKLMEWERYTGVNTCAPGEVRNYFYLDDCLFTGMTLLKDVGHWLETENPNPGSTLKIIYIAGYNGALPYVKKRLEEICAPKHIKEDRTLENRRIVFEDMEKKNIPDIVIDMSESDQERQSGYLKMFCARINPFLG